MKKRSVIELAGMLMCMERSLRENHEGNKDAVELSRLLRECAIQMKTLKKQRDRAKRAIIDMEEICALCRNRRKFDDPACRAADIECDRCGEECRCRECVKGSGFEWE